MTHPDRIDIVLLHHQDIFNHHFACNIVPRIRVVFVTVDTFYINIFAVYPQRPVNHFDFAESNVTGHTF